MGFQKQAQWARWSSKK